MSLYAHKYTEYRALSRKNQMRGGGQVVWEERQKRDRRGSPVRDRQCDPGSVLDPPQRTTSLRQRNFKGHRGPAEHSQQPPAEDVRGRLDRNRKGREDTQHGPVLVPSGRGE